MMTSGRTCTSVHGDGHAVAAAVHAHVHHLAATLHHHQVLTVLVRVDVTVCNKKQSYKKTRLW